MVHEVAAAGFNDPADYEAARPSYPPDAVAWFVEHLRIGPGARVVDLAAGTGKLTRLLAPGGADLVAAEPVAGMRDRFRAVGARASRSLACTAEHLAFRDASLDAVTVAQAFHWFDHDRAIAELARVVRRGGRVGLVWNARDRRVDWVDGVWSIMDRVEKRARGATTTSGATAPTATCPASGSCTPPSSATPTPSRPRQWCSGSPRSATSRCCPTPSAGRVLDEVRSLLATHPDTVGRAELAVPYRVDCFWFERLG